MFPDDDVTVLTGATGFLGSLVLERLIARREPVVALVRAGSDEEAQRRLGEMAELTWADRDAVAGVRALAADVESERVGMDPGSFDALASRARAIVHCAASVRFDLPYEEAASINVAGTRRVVELAERARQLDARARFVHVSTAYVHGRAEGLARENGPQGTPEFRNTYEETKHRAEREVGRLGDAAIVRPSIVVGDSRTGWTSSFNVIYTPLRALISGALEVVPARPDAILDLIPVDQVVEVIDGLLGEPGVTGVHQAVSGELAPTMQEFARLAYEHAGMSMRPCVPDESSQLGAYAPYADVSARFELGRAAALGMSPTPIEELVPRLIDFAEECGWGRRQSPRPSPATTSATA